MDKKTESIDPDFIAKGPAAAKEGELGGITTGPQPALPTVFDEQRIRKDLEKFARAPGILEQYMERLYNRFTKAGEIAFLNHWVSFYEAGRKLVEAKTALERAKTDHQQLTDEAEIKQTAKAAEIARHEAITEKHKFEKDQFAYMRKNVEQFLPMQNPLKPQPTQAKPRERKLAALANLAEEKRRKLAECRDDPECQQRVETIYDDERIKIMQES